MDNRTEQLWREILKGEPGKFWAPAYTRTPFWATVSLPVALGLV